MLAKLMFDFGLSMKIRILCGMSIYRVGGDYTLTPAAEGHLAETVSGSVIGS